MQSWGSKAKTYTQQEGQRWGNMVGVFMFVLLLHREIPEQWSELVGNLQQSPQSFPGIINIPAILMNWQSRIAWHSRDHLAHKSNSWHVLYCLKVVWVLLYLCHDMSREMAERCLAGQQVFAGAPVTRMLMCCGKDCALDTAMFCFVSIKFSHGIYNQWGCFFSEDWKWVGANDKWKRDAPFISPTSGLKWGLAATIRAASAGCY